MIRALLLILILFPNVVFALSKQEDIDAATIKNQDKFMLSAFNKAYKHMSNDHYDSAQLWLNKIAVKINYRKPTLFTYYLTTCQAEVYYYNNLHLLGLQESLKGENIAMILKDSVLIADACNFIGLFHLNNNRFKEAEKYFKRGLRYASQPPYKKKYIDLSKPHHLYGNLAETFEKLNQPDSAILYSLLALNKAREIDSKRGMATGTLNIGNAYLLKGKVDSAQEYFNLTLAYSKVGNEFDVELTGYSGLADCEAARDNKVAAFKNLAAGFDILKEFPQLNDFYASMFIDVSIKIYRKYNDVEMLNKTLELKSSKQTTTYNRNNTQIQSLLLTGIKNEKTIFNLELAESKSKQSLANTRIYILLLVLFSLVVAFVAYRYYVLQRLRLANLRSKISQDLHDEVGATLSGIAMYSYITKSQLENKEHYAVNNSLDIIKDNAGEMVAKLNDIVWAVNPIQDNLHALLERLKEFALQVVAIKDIKLEFIVPDEIKTLKLSMEQRKNIYLICKEAINNAVKYSGGSLLQVKIAYVNREIIILVEDNGSGFVADVVSKSNGLINMAARAREINAQLTIDGQTGMGTKVSLNCKIT